MIYTILALVIVAVGSFTAGYKLRTQVKAAETQVKAQVAEAKAKIADKLTS